MIFFLARKFRGRCRHPNPHDTGPHLSLAVNRTRGFRMFIPFLQAFPPMFHILLALIVLMSDVIAAVIVFNVLVRRGHPMAIPIAGFIVLAGIVSAVMVFLYVRVPAVAP